MVAVRRHRNRVRLDHGGRSSSRKPRAARTRTRSHMPHRPHPTTGDRAPVRRARDRIRLPLFPHEETCRVVTCAVETCADARDMDAVHLASHPSSGPPASDSWPRGAEPPVRSPLARSANRQPHASPTWKGAARTPLRLLRLSGRSTFPAIPASALRAVIPPCVRPPAPASPAPSPARVRRSGADAGVVQHLCPGR